MKYLLSLLFLVVGLFGIFASLDWAKKKKLFLGVGIVFVVLAIIMFEMF